MQRADASSTKSGEYIAPAAIIAASRNRNKSATPARGRGVVGTSIAQPASVRTRQWVTPVAIVIAACSQKTPDQKLADALDPATSWIATLDLASDSFLGNRVPASFIRESVKAAQKELEKAHSAVESSKAGKQLRDSVTAQLCIADDAAAQLGGAVQRSDRAAVARAKSRLAASYAALHEIEEKAGQ